MNAHLRLTADIILNSPLLSEASGGLAPMTQSPKQQKAVVPTVY